MDKHRLELFSDGVFVIVLTLLVLDLKPPLHPDGIAALRDVAPGLLVHAVSFVVIGWTWIGHHNMLAAVHHVSLRTLMMNLLALFWITLLPFGARIAAEHPLSALGIGLFTACRGFYLLSFLATRLSARSYVDDYPELKGFVRRRIWLGIGFTVFDLTMAALCWVSPWFGYAALSTVVVTFFMRPATEVVQAALDRRGEPALEEAPTQS